MSDTPWLGDACSLVDAFRSGERSPTEELEATLAAIEASDLNCFSFVDPERARAAAAVADLSLPFGGVPFGIKELDQVEGWPDTQASLLFEGRIADHTATTVGRAIGVGGTVPVGLTTASEFGGLNVSVTKLNGVTHNPWRHGRTCGGSSCGSASAVAGGLVSLASGGDGGGSIRIPAGYTGLLGFKGTYGRTSRGPSAYSRPGTVVLGNLSRSVRDAARYYDVVCGVDLSDPTALPSSGSWEADLGSHELAGRKVAILPSIAGVGLDDGVEERIRAAAEELVRATGMVRVDVTLDLPNLAAQWAMGNLSTLVPEIGSRWPGCYDDLTGEVALGMQLAESLYNIHVAGTAEDRRVQTYNEMARVFSEVDFVMCATNPGPAFPAEKSTSAPGRTFIDVMNDHRLANLGVRAVLKGARVAAGFAPRLPNLLIDLVAEHTPDVVTMGGLTILSNMYGNPAVSIPAGTVDGLPVGLQVLAPHHRDALLFDVALAAERHMPWPLVAPPVSEGAEALATA
jgi:aspartyl-tRNA(Asn)/glutamyl-tRNA(Gln) amidotransferase subunit A